MKQSYLTQWREQKRRRGRTFLAKTMLCRRDRHQTIEIEVPVIVRIGSTRTATVMEQLSDFHFRNGARPRPMVWLDSRKPARVMSLRTGLEGRHTEWRPELWMLAPAERERLVIMWRESFL